MRNHNDNDMEEDEPRTITESWRVPLYTLGSAIVLAGTVSVYATLLYERVISRLDSIDRGQMTVGQFQHWTDDARDLNPTVHWPRLPAKDAPMGLVEPRDLLRPAKFSLKQNI